MSKSHNKFEGFPKEKQTWDFPVVINGWVHKLSGAEFKVLWYIVRHTYGWQKTADTISYTQFQYGIKKQDNTFVDRGTGLSRQSISNALSQLENFGFIKKENKQGKTTCFELKFKQGTSLKSRLPQSKNHTGTSLKSRHTISNQSLKDNKSDSRIKEFLDFYFQEYQIRFGKNTKPPIKGGRDGQTVKTLLTRWNLDHLKTNVKRYVKTEDQFFKKNGYDIPRFENFLNGLQVGGYDSQGNQETAKPEKKYLN